jgi:hypothetical protein
MSQIAEGVSVLPSTQSPQILATADIRGTESDRCRDVLDDKLMTQLKITEKSQYRMALQELLEGDFSDVERKSRGVETTGDALVPIAKILVKMGGSAEYAENWFKEVKSRNKDSFSYSADSILSYELASQFLNESAIKAWGDCMADAAKTQGNRSEKFITTICGDEAAEFDVVILYQPQDASDSEVVLGSPELINVQAMQPTRIKDGVRLKPFDVSSQRFKRVDSSKPGVVRIPIKGHGESRVDLRPMPNATIALDLAASQLVVEFPTALPSQGNLDEHQLGVLIQVKDQNDAYLLGTSEEPCRLGYASQGENEKEFFVGRDAGFALKADLTDIDFLFGGTFLAANKGEPRSGHVDPGQVTTISVVDIESKWLAAGMPLSGYVHLKKGEFDLVWSGVKKYKVKFEISLAPRCMMKPK